MTCIHRVFDALGVGARLDKKPELLFTLRKVDHQELISADLDMQAAASGPGKRRRLANQDLSSMFGIDIEDTRPQKTARRSNNRKSANKKTTLGRGNSRAGDAKAAPEDRAFTPTGAAVARLRKQLSMTRAEFADLLGVSPQTVANWESIVSS